MPLFVFASCIVIYKENNDRGEKLLALFVIVLIASSVSIHMHSKDLLILVNIVICLLL